MVDKYNLNHFCSNSSVYQISRSTKYSEKSKLLFDLNYSGCNNNTLCQINDISIKYCSKTQIYTAHWYYNSHLVNLNKRNIDWVRENYIC
jgi:hypothetical protein